ncbi:MAG: DUF2069 domain-containing protein [Thiohalomonadaceae bacterium]
MNRLLLTRTATLISYCGLIALLLAWQLWLSPSSLPTGLVLTVLLGPLLLPLHGLLRGRAKSYFWTSLLALFYLLHAAGELFATPEDRPLATIEFILALILFIAALAYVRLMGGVIPRRSGSDVG